MAGTDNFSILELSSLKQKVPMDEIMMPAAREPSGMGEVRGQRLGVGLCRSVDAEERGRLVAHLVRGDAPSTARCSPPPLPSARSADRHVTARPPFSYLSEHRLS
jgi:hypothetical protein